MKTWEDQPDCVEDLAVICSFCADGVMVEVRGLAPHEHVLYDGLSSDLDQGVRDAASCVYVTAGGLFGSQTIRCIDARAAMFAIHAALHKKRHKDPVKLPDGCVLVKDESDG